MHIVAWSNFIWTILFSMKYFFASFLWSVVENFGSMSTYFQRNLFTETNIWWYGKTKFMWICRRTWLLKVIYGDFTLQIVKKDKNIVRPMEGISRTRLVEIQSPLCDFEYLEFRLTYLVYFYASRILFKLRFRRKSLYWILFKKNNIKQPA